MVAGTDHARRIARAAAIVAAMLGGVLAASVPALAEGGAGDRPELRAESSRSSLDRARRATERSLDRSDRAVRDRTVRSMDRMRLRSESHPLYVPDRAAPSER